MMNNFRNKTIRQVYHYLSQEESLMGGKYPLLKFDCDDTRYKDMPWVENVPWLTVKYKNVLGHSQEDGVKYNHLLSLSVNPNMDANELLLRIIIRLADKLRSVQQDLNIIN